MALLKKISEDPFYKNIEKPQSIATQTEEADLDENKSFYRIMQVVARLELAITQQRYAQMVAERLIKTAQAGIDKLMKGLYESDFEKASVNDILALLNLKKNDPATVDEYSQALEEAGVFGPERDCIFQEDVEDLDKEDVNKINEIIKSISSNITSAAETGGTPKVVETPPEPEKPIRKKTNRKKVIKRRS